MKTALTIRPVVQADTAAIAVLARESHEFYQNLLPKFYCDFNADEWRSKFKSVLTSNDFSMLAAENERGELCGFAILYRRTTRSPIIKPRLRLVVDNLFVRTRDRRRGIARKLLLEAVKLAGQEGCDRVELEVAAHNDAALKLYTSLGFVERTRTLEFHLPDNS